MGIRYIPPGKKSYKKPLASVEQVTAPVEIDKLIEIATESVITAQAVIEEAAQHLVQETVLPEEPVVADPVVEQVEPEVVVPQQATNSSTVNTAKRKK